MLIHKMWIICCFFFGNLPLVDELINYRGVCLLIIFGMWQVTHDTWHMTHDRWYMTHNTQVPRSNSLGVMTSHDMWHMTHDTWNVTQDTRHRKCDIWHRVGSEHCLERAQMLCLSLNEDGLLTSPLDFFSIFFCQ